MANDDVVWTPRVKGVLPDRLINQGISKVSERRACGKRLGRHRRARRRNGSSWYQRGGEAGRVQTSEARNRKRPLAPYGRGSGRLIGKANIARHDLALPHCHRGRFLTNESPGNRMPPTVHGNILRRANSTFTDTQRHAAVAALPCLRLPGHARLGVR